MKISRKLFSCAPFDHSESARYEEFLVSQKTQENWLRLSLSEPGFPLAVAPMLAHLANLAYQGSAFDGSSRSVCEQQLEQDLNAQYIARFENKNAEGYGFVFEDVAFLIFCGTNDLSLDWVDNLMAVRKAQTFDEQITRDIHMGFARHFNLLKPLIDGWVLGLPSNVKSYVCTGHSLGGTLAVLMAQVLGQQGKDVATVMTFGSPAAGGQRFHDDYPWHDRTWRVVDLGDPIPRSTPEYVGFRHVGSAISSRTRFDEPFDPDKPRSAPKEFAIFPNAKQNESLGSSLKNIREKALNMYRERPRHCKSIYRTAMQRMLEENLPDVTDSLLRSHYDYLGMSGVDLFRDS